MQISHKSHSFKTYYLRQNNIIKLKEVLQKMLKLTFLIKWIILFTYRIWFLVKLVEKTV